MMKPSTLEPLVELLGGVDRVLTDHRVGDQEDVLGRGRVDDVLELFHQGVVDGESTGGVEEDDVAAFVFGDLDRFLQTSTGSAPSRA